MVQCGFHRLVIPYRFAVKLAQHLLQSFLYSLQLSGSKGNTGYEPTHLLVGPRGCGKTTVGLELARLCQSQFVDTDHWLQENAGKTIADIVEDEGWESFRARETATLEAVTAPSTVIATGGASSGVV